MAIIYMIKDIINNKKYIGQTVRTLQERIYNHHSDAMVNMKDSLIARAIRKYGWDSFEIKTG